LTIWELVVLLELGGVAGLGLISFTVEGDEAELLLDLSNDLLPSGGTTLLSHTIGGEEVAHMISDGSTGNIVLLDGMWNGETLIDWDSVGNTIS
jgi:hypothetical protein